MGSEASFYALTERYPDEASAERYFIGKRWPNGVVCVKCKSHDVVRGVQKSRHRQVWRCRDCDAQFSVTSGTVMDSTKLPLKKWLLAFHFMGASKKGMSALQLSRMLHVTYHAAWHLCHRIRKTMGSDIGKFSGTVESDETYIGGKRKKVGRGYRKNKMAVQTIVRRNTAHGRHDSQAVTIALSPVGNVDGRTVGAKLRKHTDPPNTILMTDEAGMYQATGESFAEHHTVNHKQEEYAYTHPDGCLATTNSAEGLFSNLKRQVNGTHHHTSKKHLPRYLTEFDFKFNNREMSDVERTEKAIEQSEGKRLRLYKSRSGRGESLYNHKVDEPAPDYVPPDGSESDESESPPERRRRKSKARKTTAPSGTDEETAE